MAHSGTVRAVLPRPLYGARIYRIILAALLMVGVGAMPARAAVMIFAAASTTTAIEDALGVFSRSGSEPVRAAFAASSTLAQQIANGAPADVFVSANTQWMDFLAREGAIVAASRVDLLTNRLVLVVWRPKPGAPPRLVLNGPSMAAHDLMSNPIASRSVALTPTPVYVAAPSITVKQFEAGLRIER